MKKTQLLFIILIISTVLSLSAQKKKTTTYSNTNSGQSQTLATDTVQTSDPETWIIFFSNNTWKYYRPSLMLLDSISIYKNHWDTTQVFAYKDIELNDMAESVVLSLYNTLSEASLPIQGRVYSKYGPRGRRNHNGVDIPLTTGEPIKATFEGKIRYARYNSGGFGNLVIVRHTSGLETWYAHLSKLNCHSGDYVKSGDVIGFGGSTGRSRGPHLHFEMRYQDQTFDPQFIFDFEKGELLAQNFTLKKTFFNIHSRASEILEEEEEYAEILASNGGDSTIVKQIIDKREKERNAIKYHTVKSGDMLGKIATKYGTTVSHICMLNNIKSTTLLKVNQKLRVS